MPNLSLIHTHLMVDDNYSAIGVFTNLKGGTCQMHIFISVQSLALKTFHIKIQILGQILHLQRGGVRHKGSPKYATGQCNFS